MPETGGAVIRPLFNGVERRQVFAEKELHCGLSVPEDVVARAEARHQVLLMQWTVLLRKYRGHGQQIIGADLLVPEVVAQVLEAHAALQREAAYDPPILRI